MRMVLERGCAFVIMALGAVGCGGDVNQASDEVGVVGQALDFVTTVPPPGYPNVGISYDGVSTLLHRSGNWDDRPGVISPRVLLSNAS
ncbi:MAG: hypothetical protein ABIQ16_17765, partial [Polyangiaceae bacterium]